MTDNPAYGGTGGRFLNVLPKKKERTLPYGRSAPPQSGIIVVSFLRNLFSPSREGLPVQFMDLGRKMFENRAQPDILFDVEKL
jgi:hypothetical protein